ncbi:HtrA protease/chaperone protein [Thermodesulfovibrio sp. N1]|nr:HtrA protease/chaperone protein [Thermodesulfovibrio sp. N1]
MKADFENSLKDSIENIEKNFFSSLISLNKGIGVAIDKNIVIAPLDIVEGSKNIVAVDSKLNLVFLKIDKNLSPVSFQIPQKKNNIFFLLTLIEEPKILVVKGNIQESKAIIEGNHTAGSLLISPELNPLGIVIKSASNSEVLLLGNFYSDINRLIKRKPGWLGLQAQTVTNEIGRIIGISQGAIITNIYEGGPSDKAGLKRGDVIVEIDSIKVNNLNELQREISVKFAGETIELKVFREGIQKIFKVTMEEPPAQIGFTEIKPLLQIQGVEVSEIPEAVKTSLKRAVNGVFVKKVSENSHALGILKEGDIIVEINKKSLSNIKEFYELLTQSARQDLLILVYRQDSFQYVILPAQKSH